MKIVMETNYTTLQRMMENREEFFQAISKFQSTSPRVDLEGVVGYSSVDVEFDVRDLEKFTKLWYNSIGEY